MNCHLPSYALLACILLPLISLCDAVPLDLFYPFANNTKDKFLQQGDDVSSHEIQLNAPIFFYNRSYSSLYINSNGHISFETEVPMYMPNMVLPLGYKVIAAFLADIDTTAAGFISYRETNASSVLQRAAADVRTHFINFRKFDPRSVVIVTWFQVGHFKAKLENVNTFQVVIISGEGESFCFLHYLSDGINWIVSDGKMSPQQGDPPAQAGFDSGVGRYHLKLPFSGTTSIADLASKSNTNVPGVWMYKIGDKADPRVRGADFNVGEEFVFNVDKKQMKCLEGARTCHQSARCIDYNPGYCCECVRPFYGNGKSCLEEGVPQRLNGKVDIRVNDVQVTGLDQHSYVVTSDGRSYTAISRMPPEIGHALQTLTTIGGVIGWMFAVPTNPRAKNGYMITGGLFNRTTVVRYQSGETITITQTFYGQDALNNIRVDTRIYGKLPSIPPETKISIDDFQETYKRVTPGTIKSYSPRTYRVDGVALRYTWDQTIMYTECSLDRSFAAMGDLSLSVSRVFVLFNDDERIVRYAMTNRISTNEVVDVCTQSANLCGEFADCASDGFSYKCSCKTGYSGDGQTCQDIDECETSHPCDEHAKCDNTPGSYRCQCLPGYRGDGRNCNREPERRRRCGEFQCDSNARCVYDSKLKAPVCECNRGYQGDGTTCTVRSSTARKCGKFDCNDNARCVYNSEIKQPVCECNPGYTGDGLTCLKAQFTCNEVDNCPPNSECTFVEESRRYECVCNEGFSGDGATSCEEDIKAETSCKGCDANAACLYDADKFIYRCQCKQGFTGDGKSCTSIDECGRCDRNAVCEFIKDHQSYRCHCRLGYRGDGYNCESDSPIPAPTPDCSVLRDCSPNAQCLKNSDTGAYQCVCNRGLKGDGKRCEPAQCNDLKNCHKDAECRNDPRDPTRYACVCRAGYTGDGYKCTSSEVTCNEVCNANAECLYDPDTQKYTCRCRRGYRGDGRFCQKAELDCSQNRSLCDRNARCSPQGHRYACVCNPGYRGDGKRCQGVDEFGGYLVFAQSSSLMQRPVTEGDPSIDIPSKLLLYRPGETIIGLSYDCSGKKLYWTDIRGKAINRANINGSQPLTILSGLGSPEGIAIDWLSKNMYWTDSDLDRIEVARLDGSNRMTLIDSDLVNPRSIVVDPANGMMFWSDWNRVAPKIEKAMMDGSERSVLVSQGLGLPNALALDPWTQTLCWADAGTKKIECIRTDGSGRRTLYSDALYPFGMTTIGGRLIWTDWRVKALSNLKIDGTKLGEPLPLPLGGNDRLYGITAVQPQCPRVNNNGCMVNNGGCPYLCLPTANGGRTCRCALPQELCEEHHAKIFASGAHRRG